MPKELKKTISPFFNNANEKKYNIKNGISLKAQRYNIVNK